MGSFSIGHWLVVAVIALLVFGGRGRLSSIAGDLAGGIKAFKKGMSDDAPAKDDAKKSDPPRNLEFDAKKERDSSNV